MVCIPSCHVFITKLERIKLQGMYANYPVYKNAESGATRKDSEISIFQRGA